MAKEQWRSGLGFVLAAAGSAVGLGNLWGFAYRASQGGGGAFLLLYVVMGIVGCAGLLPTLAAIRAGKDLALANKETLIAAGPVVLPELKKSGSRLLPADSEHSAIFQCLQGTPWAENARLSTGVPLSLIHISEPTRPY